MSFKDRVLESTTTTGTGTLTLAGAVTGYQTFAVVGNGGVCPYVIFAVNTNGTPNGDWEVGIGTYTSSGTTLSRDKVLASSNANALVSFAAGTKYVGLNLPASMIDDGTGLCEGRLTLTTGTAVTTSNVSAATSVYFTPYNGNRVSVYNGNSWEKFSFTERTLALGTLSSGKNYDVFLYSNSGTLTLESLVWTDDTTRATALTLQNGVLVKSGATTRRYLGTFRTTSTTTTEDSETKRFLWNQYNRVERSMNVIDTTNQWSYTTNAWRQANGNTANKVEFLVGSAEDPVSAILIQSMGYDPGSFSISGIGLDSLTARSGITAVGYNNNIAAISLSLTATYRGYPGVGYHYLAWLEHGLGSPAGSIFYGDNGESGIRQSGMTAAIRG